MDIWTAPSDIDYAHADRPLRIEDDPSTRKEHEVWRKETGQDIEDDIAF